LLVLPCKLGVPSLPRVAAAARTSSQACEQACWGDAATCVTCRAARRMAPANTRAMGGGGMTLVVHRIASSRAMPCVPGELAMPCVPAARKTLCSCGESRLRARRDASRMRCRAALARARLAVAERRQADGSAGTCRSRSVRTCRTSSAAS
jgi:hypothetical protein